MSTMTIESGTHFGKIAAIRSGNRVNLFQNSSTDSDQSQDVISLAPEQALDLAMALIESARPESSGQVTNADRAAWAGAAVAAYRASHKGDGDPQTALGDMLCDLWHYADANDLDYGLAGDIAERHHEEEVELEKAYGPGAAG